MVTGTTIAAATTHFRTNSLLREFFNIRQTWPHIRSLSGGLAFFRHSSMRNNSENNSLSTLSLLLPAKKYFNFLSRKNNDFTHTSTLKKLTNKTYDENYENTYKENNCERNVIRHLRNAVWHRRLTIYPLTHNKSTEIQKTGFNYFYSWHRLSYLFYSFEINRTLNSEGVIELGI